MISLINSNYFSIISTCGFLFILSCLYIAVTLSDKQVENKDADGHIQYTKVQDIIMDIGVAAFWMGLIASAVVVISHLSSLLMEMM